MTLKTAIRIYESENEKDRTQEELQQELNILERILSK